ncbi:MAG TPA: DUF4440 domain-containing protein [Gemmatimonadales bacterium]|nr:DUF4440 domain-containing protein [Gemmatimonadales bacterium]
MRPLIALLVLLAACQATAPPLSDADKAAIRAVTDSLVVYMRANRDSDLAGLYTRHAVFMPPNAGIVEGRPAILANFQVGPAMTDFTLTNVDIDGRGDLAYVRGTYSFAMPPAAGRPALNDHGKFLEIRRRQPDGKWLISTDIYNSDIPK